MDRQKFAFLKLSAALSLAGAVNDSANA